tara:strand:+ start:4288 stop:4770 length:483 start_codon:yes stop_codon:yes gene_type:complete
MIKILELIGEFLVEKLQSELRDQGHVATGNLINSIKYKVTGDFSVEITTNKDYVTAMENGLPSGHYVPIDALIRWVEVKGIATGSKEVRDVAYAIRQTIFKEGSPTKGAFRFTSNGRRVGFAQYVLDQYTKKIVTMASAGLVQEFTQPIRNAVKYTNKIK